MTNIIIDSIAYYVPELCDVFSILEHQMSLHYYVQFSSLLLFSIIVSQ